MDIPHEIPMYNLYQSQLRKDIQSGVYKKIYHSIPLFDQEYNAVIRSRKIWPVTIQRIQILWVQRPEDKQYIKSQLKIFSTYIRKQYPHVVFVQFGLLNEIIHFSNRAEKRPNFEQDMRINRELLHTYMQERYGLRAAFRENMPQANVVYDVKHTDEELIADMNKWCKARVKKSLKSDITFNVAPWEYYDEFYKQRVRLAGSKWFNIITPDQFRDLMRYLKDNQCGEIFVAEKDGELVAGSICLLDQDRIIYLYGFANRAFQKIGWHHFLKFKIFGRARDHNIEVCDMLGAAPTGYPEHSLAGVSKFKESLWGTKIEMYGSYDLPLKPLLYRLVKWVYMRKG